jgi:hypothetical protein
MSLTEAEKRKVQLRIFEVLKATGFMHAFTGQEAADIFDIEVIEDVIATKLSEQQCADLVAAGYMSWYVIARLIKDKKLLLPQVYFTMGRGCATGSPEQQLMCALAAASRGPASRPKKQTREQALAAASSHTYERISAAEKAEDTLKSERQPVENKQLAASRKYVIQWGRKRAPPGMDAADILQTYGILVTVLSKRFADTIPVYVPVFEGRKTPPQFCTYVLNFLLLKAASCSAQCRVSDVSQTTALSAQEYQRCPATLHVEW